MKNTRNTIMAGLFLMLILPEVTLAKINLQSPYFGINVGLRENGFYAGRGNSLLKSRQPVGEFFVGLEEVFSNLNLEINIEKTIDCKKQSTLNRGDNLFGQTVIIPVGSVLNLNTKMQFLSIGVDLIYKIKPIDCENFSFLFGPGIKIAKLNLSAKNTNSGTEIAKFTNENTKTLLKFSAGYEYMVTNNYGLRGLVTWENTSVLKPIAASVFNGRKFTAQKYCKL